MFCRFYPIEDKDMEVPEGAITVFEFISSVIDEDYDEFIEWTDANYIQGD